MRPPISDRLPPWAFIVPGMILVIGWWALPTIQTVWLVLFEGGSWSGTEHGRWLLTDSSVRLAVRNTVAWGVVVTVGSTLAGLGFALAADRFRARRLVVSIVLMPAVVSLVAVGVMWRLVYAFRPSGSDQVGFVNAVWTTVGLEPVAWLVQAPVNTVLLALAMVWVQSGIAMLVLSAAVTRVPDAAKDAARVDGASEGQIFTRITVPTIRGAIVLAGATSAIVAIRVFDLVQVATAGQYGTEVLATEMFSEAFVANRPGQGALVAVVMLALVVPLGAVLVGRARRAERARVVSVEASS